jgi:hypothetical protein
MLSSTTHYQFGKPPVTATGLGLPQEHLDRQLSGPVAASVFDDAGHESIKNLLQSVTDTDFKKDNLEALLEDETTVEDWRVGEALAEQYLSDYRNCHFPWPDGRDERKRGSSLPGADLVGFQVENDKERFAFGEVKTSAERKYPPGAMHGRHGLKQQLEDLRDRKKIRDNLVKYLGHRASESLWRERYKNAMAHYLQNSADVRVFGILVRDVTPHTDDLHARAEKLAVDCPVAMRIELIAIYLPQGSISTLSETVTASRKHGKGNMS